MDKFKKTLIDKMAAKGRTYEMSFKFKVMDTDELRVVMALSVMETFETKPQAICKTKDAKVSINLRNEANRLFISNKNNVEKFVKAWELYSESIVTAPNTSQELSLSFANRSAVLRHLKKYTECIEDINRALELNYPDHLKGQLLYRKIECLNYLNSIENMEHTIEEARCWMENVTLCSEEKEKFGEKLNNIAILNSTKQESKKMSKISDFPTFIPQKQIPCASESLTIKYDEKFGRHVVTTRKINPGEILVIEKPYAKLLKPREIYTHCSHCLQIHWAMIPCEHCIYAMYCSEKCKKEAWNQYHDIECPVTGYLLDLDFDKCGLFSMRLAILAMKEAGSIEKLRNDLEKVDNVEDPYKKGFAEDGIYHSDKYQTLYTLVTNVDKRSVSNLFEKALDAAVILYYLCTLTNLFGKRFSLNIHNINMNVDVTYVGGLILRHLQIIPSNMHTYEEARIIDLVDIGVAALPFCSLINHSCDPNVSRCLTNESMIVFALVPIDAGSQIFDNYGSHYAVMPKIIREEKLKQFYFKCECIACIKNWPTYTGLQSYNILLTDKVIKSKIRKALENFYTYLSYVEEGRIENKPYLLTDLSKMIEILIKYVPLPCYEVNNVVETLKQVFELTYKNKFEIPKL